MRVDWFRVGAASALIGVAAGAFGAHGLKARVDPTDLQAFETGVRYHLVHALALVILGLLPPGRAVRLAGWLFLAGTILFAGSLYVLGVTGSRALVLLTPLGGVAFLAGWAILVINAPRLRGDPESGP